MTIENTPCLACSCNQTPLHVNGICGNCFDGDKLTKQALREVARKLSKTLGLNISSGGLVDEGFVSFQIKRKKTYTQTDEYGNILKPSRITDDLFTPDSGEYVYSETRCLESEVLDGSLKYMLKHGLTR